MTQRRPTVSRASAFIFVLSLFATSSDARVGPAARAISDFDAYVRSVESRLAKQHQGPDGFLAPANSTSGPSDALSRQIDTRLRQGELIVEQVTPPSGNDLPGALVHHWRGTAFAPGAKASDFARMMKDFNAYPRYYAPEVIRAKVLTQQGDHMQATMQVRQQHVITVVLDTTYDILFSRLDASHGFSTTRSVRVAEVGSPGTAAEHELSTEEEHGFLWRTNTYWSYEEREGGLYMQVESISLTRSIPRGLGWAIGPFVESVPRESLEFTLRSTCNALRK